MSNYDVIKEGYFEKRPRGLKQNLILSRKKNTFEKRYFVLTPDSIKWFSSQKQYQKNHDNPNGKIDLRTVKLVESVEAEVENTFKISYTDSDGVHYLTCQATSKQSPDRAEDWIQEIKEASEKAGATFLQVHTELESGKNSPRGTSPEPPRPRANTKRIPSAFITLPETNPLRLNILVVGDAGCDMHLTNPFLENYCTDVKTVKNDNMAKFASCRFGPTDVGYIDLTIADLTQANRDVHDANGYVELDTGLNQLATDFQQVTMEAERKRKRQGLWSGHAIDVVLVCFSYASMDSLSNLQAWMDEFKETAQKDKPYLVVGCRKDACDPIRDITDDDDLVPLDQKQISPFLNMAEFRACPAIPGNNKAVYSIFMDAIWEFASSRSNPKRDDWLFWTSCMELRNANRRDGEKGKDLISKRAGKRAAKSAEIMCQYDRLWPSTSQYRGRFLEMLKLSLKNSVYTPAWATFGRIVCPKERRKLWEVFEELMSTEIPFYMCDLFRVFSEAAYLPCRDGDDHDEDGKHLDFLPMGDRDVMQWASEKRKSKQMKKGSKDQFDRLREIVKIFIEAEISLAPKNVQFLTQVHSSLKETHAHCYQGARQAIQRDSNFDTFQELLSKAIQSLPDNIICQQTTPDIQELYDCAASAKMKYDSLMSVIEVMTEQTFIQVDLKGENRVLEKSGLRPEEDRRFQCDKVLDVVRGSLASSNVRGLSENLRFLLSCDKTIRERCELDGWWNALTKSKQNIQTDIVIVRIKDRFTRPTEGGWSDVMINFYFADDTNKHICEAQLAHEEMMKVRVPQGAHHEYNRVRTAFELLEAIHKAPKIDHQDTIDPKDTSERRIEMLTNKVISLEEELKSLRKLAKLANYVPQLLALAQNEGMSRASSFFDSSTRSASIVLADNNLEEETET
eukprot:m.131604 g.131604  ORF g.131604 m.131604 type:complete len:906 (+) comp14629_c0_seq4:142-2859(+)